MLIENTQVFGFEAAFRGMRNPKNSWDKSDSTFQSTPRPISVFGEVDIRDFMRDPVTYERPKIGPNDLKLALNLIKAGGPHRKFLRMINIWVDLTLPRYVWTELDTYKVATVRDSCSTMHKISSRLLVQKDFQHPVSRHCLFEFNALISKYNSLSTGDHPKAKYILFKQLKNRLPEGFLQKATYEFNYETALGMLSADCGRANHRLDEWNLSNPDSICSWIKSLPYMKEFSDALYSTNSSN